MQILTSLSGKMFAKLAGFKINGFRTQHQRRTFHRINTQCKLLNDLIWEAFVFIFGLVFPTAQNMNKLLQLSLDCAEEVCDYSKQVVDILIALIRSKSYGLSWWSMERNWRLCVLSCFSCLRRNSWWNFFRKNLPYHLKNFL